MAEFINRALRVNSAIDGLAALNKTRADRVAAVPTTRSFTTTPKGEVLNRFGAIVYTPTPVKQEAKRK